MKNILIFTTILLIGCFNIKKENSLSSNNVIHESTYVNDSLDIRVKQLLKTKLTVLPIGLKNIFETSEMTLYNKDNQGETELNNELIYSSNDEILHNFFHNFYKPKISSSIEEDGYPLFDEKEYMKNTGVKSSGLENVIHAKENLFCCIFYVNYYYERELETFVKPIRYLVSFNQKLEILDEFPLSYFYESQTRSSIKLFYIDENYNLFTKYYKNKEYEDGRIKETFSELYSYKISPKGTIINK